MAMDSPDFRGYSMENSMKALRSRICENFERVSVSEFIIQGLSNERLVSNWIVEMILNKSYFDASVKLCRYSSKRYNFSSNQ